MTPEPEQSWTAGERYYWFSNNPWTRLPPRPQGCFGCFYWFLLILITGGLFFFFMGASPV